MPDEELYDLVELPPPSPRARPAAVPAAHAPLAYQSRRSAKDEPDGYFPDKTIDFHLPLVLLVSGIAIELVGRLFSCCKPQFTFTLRSIGVDLMLGTAVMLVGVLIAARLRQIELGRLPVAVLKLAAICVAPGAAVVLLSSALRVIPLGWIIGLIVQFVLYFALIGTLLKLDESDTWFVVWVVVILNVGLQFAIMAA